ncbi:hypothetical protein PPYR_13016 [Photinus pyralis]|uniref:Zinc finger HIT domain-containing protein 3 n=1 Tax=Photinus pyralis TaxID=7054 RepID=A0A1Y1LI57_PHOPY|nr:zinc finger HIT domain-containing protein 3 [Photinus pyralis]KAB0793396.1 hypothetical protein PPYR_13016 [Photinus pyralis]
MKPCIICKDKEGKYKCPTCLVYYCSVTCCNEHRNTKCTLTKRKEEEIVEDSNKYEFRARDTIPHKKLKLLEEDKTLKNVLANPHLRSLLKTVDKSEQPETIMQKAMLEPIFVEFADACLKVVEPESTDD